MIDNWRDALSRLDKLEIFEYFKNRSMPEFVEPTIASLLHSFGRSPKSEQEQLIAEMTPRAGSVFSWYARKLAGKAVRNRSMMDLQHGMLAMAIAADKGDYRDDLPILALLYNSAILLDVNPTTLFETASGMSTPTVQDLFNAFLARSPKIRSIDSFGFREGAGPHGFDYVPLLVEDGGPAPF